MHGGDGMRRFQRNIARRPVLFVLLAVWAYCAVLMMGLEAMYWKL